MRVQVRFYKWDSSYRVVGAFDSLREARERLGLVNLKRKRYPDLLAELGVSRAYTQPSLDGAWVAYPWKPEPPKTEWVKEPLVWPRTAKPGEMKVLADGELVECHVCGEPVRSVGHHARWRHGLSPAEYRERFGLNRQTPLCAPAYSLKCRRRNQRLGLGRYVRPYQFVYRPDIPPRPRRLEARRNIGEGRRATMPSPEARRRSKERAGAVRATWATDWGQLFGGQRALLRAGSRGIRSQEYMEAVVTMTDRRSEVARLLERQELLDASTDLEADIALARERFGISLGGIVDDVWAEHPEWGNSVGGLDEAVDEREGLLLSDPRMRDYVEELVAKYDFPLRHYFAERLLYEDVREVDWIDEELAEHELEILKATQEAPTRPPLWTGYDPRRSSEASAR